ncbi:hypothetical protein E4U55_003909 [Claviceps digitariae]|nr:hypothetical protein E4U55_003909 [Claviceps digitariae]
MAEASPAHTSTASKRSQISASVVPAASGLRVIRATFLNSGLALTFFERDSNPTSKHMYKRLFTIFTEASALGYMHFEK